MPPQKGKKPYSFTAHLEQHFDSTTSLTELRKYIPSKPEENAEAVRDDCEGVG